MNVTDETKLEKKNVSKNILKWNKKFKKKCNIFFQTLCYYILEEV